MSTGQTQIVSGTAHDNVILVTLDPNDPSKLNIDIDGVTQSYSIHDQITIQAGQGHDYVLVDPKVTVGLTIEGGDGNDQILGGSGHDTIRGGRGNDRINAGAGDDQVQGGDGNDRINAGAGNDVVEGNHGIDYINADRGNDTVRGGQGDDVIYGGDGNDQIEGGFGDDYLDGGVGNDTLKGDAGQDVASGGLGNDQIAGGGNRDVIYSGQGQDVVIDAGQNQIYAQQGDVIQGQGNQVTLLSINRQLGSSIQIDSNSTPEFRARVNADLEMLRSSPTGQQMLAALDQSGRTVTIVHETNENGYAEPLDAAGQTFDPLAGDANNPPPILKKDQNNNVIPGPSYDVRVRYNPAFNPSTIFQPYESQPANFLYHELSHAYNIATGTLQPNSYQQKGHPDHGKPNAERQAVGLNNQGHPYDFDQNPATAPTTANPDALTENGLLREQNRAPRGNYILPQVAPHGLPIQKLLITQNNYNLGQVASDYSDVMNHALTQMPTLAAFELSRETISDMYPNISASDMNDIETIAAQQLQQSQQQVAQSTLEIGA